MIKKFLPVAEAFKKLDAFIQDKLAPKLSSRHANYGGTNGGGGGVIMQSFCSALKSLKKATFIYRH